MKKILVKRILSLTLAGTMIFSMAACGNQQTTTNPSESTTSESTVKESTEVKETEPVAAEVTYPIEGAAELTHWTFNQPPVASVYTSWKESPYHIGLQENTGVNVDWIYPAAGADVNETYNLLLTDSELPNMISYKTTVSDAQLLCEDGMIYDLTDYIPTYAPDYWEYLNSNEALLKAAKSDDGHIYGVGAYIEGDYNATYIGPVIRQDWLDECGLTTPVTLEDWEKVLVAFKDKYDATFAFNSKRYNIGIASGTGAQAGIFSGDWWYVDENNEVQYGCVEEEYKELLTVLNRWYEMGLIDQDSFTMNDNDLRAKALNNEVGISVTAMSQMTNWIADAEKSATGAKWAGFEYPRTEAGAATSRIQSQNLNQAGVTMITTSCSEEEMITALKWLNYGFTEEGLMYKNFGTEGETYTLNANGEAEWTATMTEDPDGLSVAVTKYTGAHATALATVQAARMVQIKNNEASANAVYKWIENTDNAKYMLPTLALTSDETIAYTETYNNIKAKAAEYAMKFIIGEESLDNFSTFVDTLNGMGLEDCQTIQQTAYDRYLAR